METDNEKLDMNITSNNNSSNSQPCMEVENEETKVVVEEAPNCSEEVQMTEPLNNAITPPTAPDLLEQIKELSALEYVVVYWNMLTSNKPNVPSQCNISDNLNKTDAEEERNNHTKLLKFLNDMVREETKVNVTRILGEIEKLSVTDHASLKSELLKHGAALVELHKSTVTKCDIDFSQTTTWIKTHLEEESSEKVFKDQIYSEYCEFCETNIMTPFSTTDFEILMKQIFPNVQQISVKTMESLEVYYVGLQKRLSLYSPTLPKLKQKQTSADAKFLEISSHHCSINSISSSSKLCIINRSSNPQELGENLLKESAASNPTRESTSQSSDSTDLSNNEKSAEDSKINPESSNVQLKGKEFDCGINSLNVPNGKTVPSSSNIELPDTTATAAAASTSATVITTNNNKRKKYKELRHSSVQALVNSYKDIIIPASVCKLNVDPKIDLDNEDASIWYEKNLLMLRERLSNMTIRKIRGTRMFRLKCKCCDNEFEVMQDHAIQLMQLRSKLMRKLPPKMINSYGKIHEMKRAHFSIKKLYKQYPKVVIPSNLFEFNIDPVVKINKDVVLNWYVDAVNDFRQKLSYMNREVMTKPIKLEFDSSVVVRHNTSPRQSKAKMMNFCETNSSDTESTEDIKPHQRLKIRNTQLSTSSESDYNGDSSSTTDTDKITMYRQSLQRAAKRAPSSLSEMLADVPCLKKEKITAANNCILDTSQQTDIVPIVNNDQIPVLNQESTSIQLVCEFCKDLLNSEEELEIHQKRHLACRTCKRKLRDFDIMRQHLEKHCIINRNKQKPFLRLQPIDSVESVLKQYSQAFLDFKKYTRPTLTQMNGQTSILRPLLSHQKADLANSSTSNLCFNNLMLDGTKNSIPITVNISKKEPNQKNCSIPSTNNPNRRYMVKFMQIVDPANPTNPNCQIPGSSQNGAFFQLENPTFQQKQVLQTENNGINNIVLLHPQQLPVQNSNILYRTYVINGTNNPTSSSICLPTSNGPITSNIVKCTPDVNSQFPQPGNVIQFVGSPSLVQYTNRNNASGIYPHRDHSYHQVPLYPVNNIIPNLNQNAISSVVSQISNDIPPTEVQNTNPPPVSTNFPTPHPFRIRVKDIKELS